MLTLYQFRHSAFCLKIRMALHAKKILYRVQEVTPGVGQVEIFQLSGQKQLPIIVDDNNQIISDSSNICKYIDKKNSNNNLYPSDPSLFSLTKIIEDWADTTMASICKKSLIQATFENPNLRSALLPDEIPTSIRGVVDKLPLNNLSKITNIVLSSKDNIEFQSILEALSQSLAKKRFLVGDSLTIADIAVAAQLSMLKFPLSSGSTLSGEGCQEFINNPYLDNLFTWRDELEKSLFFANPE